MEAEEKNPSCPIACALSKVGDAWSMLILRDAMGGARRFDELRRNLGIAPNILSKRLSALVAAGLLEKQRYCEHPPRDVYRLTQGGRDFLPVLVVLSDWGARHFGPADGPRLVDAGSGRAIVPVVVDRNTGAALGEREWHMAMP